MRARAEQQRQVGGVDVPSKLSWGSSSEADPLRLLKKTQRRQRRETAAGGQHGCAGGQWASAASHRDVPHALCQPSRTHLSSSLVQSMTAQFSDGSMDLLRGHPPRYRRGAIWDEGWAGGDRELECQGCEATDSKGGDTTRRPTGDQEVTITARLRNRTTRQSNPQHPPCRTRFRRWSCGRTSRPRGSRCGRAGAAPPST